MLKWTMDPRADLLSCLHLCARRGANLSSPARLTQHSKTITRYYEGYGLDYLEKKRFPGTGRAAVIALTRLLGFCNLYSTYNVISLP